MAEVNATRDCVVCGATFPRYKIKAVCSDACAAIRQREYEERSRARKPIRVKLCRWCSAEFITKLCSAYCRDECARAARDRLESERRATQEYKGRQKKIYAAWVDRNREKLRKASTKYKAARRAACGREDRTKEYEAKRLRNAAAKARDVGRLIDDACRIIAKITAIAPIGIGLCCKKVARADKIPPRRLIATPGQSEYTKQLKASPVAYIAALGRWRAKTLKRKTGKTMIDDGTASAVAVSLMATKSCLYCACGLTDESRTIDHMDPLSKGGAHSASNLCACCSSCNNKKGARGFMQFVSGLSDKHRRRAVAYYERLNRYVQQGSLSFGMAA